MLKNENDFTARFINDLLHLINIHTFSVEDWSFILNHKEICWKHLDPQGNH